MDKKNKILLKIVIVILVVVLVTTLVLSAVYAKYVSDKKPNPSIARPAAFELVIDTPMDDEIEVNFAADGEPGAPIGYTMATKDYDFAVKTNLSEVAASYMVDVVFEPHVANKIRQAREDRFADGIWCDYVIIRGVEATDKSGKKYIKYDEANVIEGKEILGTNNTELTWTYSTTVKPSTNPDSVTTDKTYYRLRMIFYNNTMMKEKELADGTKIYNSDDYLFKSDAITINVTSQQIDPQFVGKYGIK